MSLDKTPKRTNALVILRLIYTFCFYPMLIAVTLWLYYIKAHWMIGAALILAVLFQVYIWQALVKAYKAVFHTRAPTDKDDC